MYNQQCGYLTMTGHSLWAGLVAVAQHTMSVSMETDSIEKRLLRGLCAGGVQILSVYVIHTRGQCGAGSGLSAGRYHVATTTWLTAAAVGWLCCYCWLSADCGRPSQTRWVAVDGQTESVDEDSQTPCSPWTTPGLEARGAPAASWSPASRICNLLCL